MRTGLASEGKRCSPRLEAPRYLRLQTYTSADIYFPSGSILTFGAFELALSWLRLQGVPPTTGIRAESNARLSSHADITPCCKRSRRLSLKQRSEVLADKGR